MLTATVMKTTTETTSTTTTELKKQNKMIGKQSKTVRNSGKLSENDPQSGQKKFKGFIAIFFKNLSPQNFFTKAYSHNHNYSVRSSEMHCKTVLSKFGGKCFNSKKQAFSISKLPIMFKLCEVFAVKNAT